MPRIGTIATAPGGLRLTQQEAEEAAMRTVYFVGDAHYGSENADPAPTGPPTNPNVRQVAALNACYGALHPLGGVVKRPQAVIQLGDAVHENTETMARYTADYTVNGTGTVKAPCYTQDGNHHYVGGTGLPGAPYPIVAEIVARHGSLTWGVKIGPVYFQSMGDNPSAADIAGEITTKVNARPASEPIFFMVHRSLDSPGYEGEFGAGALDALETLMASRNTLGILHAHSHYDSVGTWRGFKRIAPGSVRQSPVTPPYTTTFKEGFVVMRISSNWYDVAHYVFGYTNTGNGRVWAPNTWSWSERNTFTT